MASARRNEVGGALMASGEDMIARKHYRKAIVCFQAVCEGNGIFGEKLEAVAMVRKEVSYFMAYHDLKQMEKFHSHARSALDVCIARNLPSLLLQTLSEYIQRIELCSYASVTDLILSLVRKLQPGVPTPERAILHLMAAHTALLSPKSTSANVMTCAIESINALGPNASSFIITYARALQMCIKAKESLPTNMGDALEALEAAVKLFDKDKKRTSVTGGGVTVRWKGLKCMVSIARGMIERMQAQIQNSNDSFSKAFEHSKDHPEADWVQNELRVQMVVNYLLMGKYESCAKLLHYLLQTYIVSRKRQERKKRKMSRKNNSRGGEGERLLLMYLCGRYAEATGHISESKNLLTQAWRIALDEQFQDQIELKLALRLRHVWSTVCAATNQSNPKMLSAALVEAKKVHLASQKIRNGTLEIYALLAQASALVSLGQHLQSLEIFRLALTTANTFRHKLATCASLAGISDILLRLGNVDQLEPARKSAEEALMLSAKMKDGVGQLSVLHLLMECLRIQKRPEKLEKLEEYKRKRVEEVRTSIFGAQALESHKYVIEWDGSCDYQLQTVIHR